MKYIFWLLTLSFISCTHPVQESSLKKWDVSFASAIPSIRLSEFASSVECIPLAVRDSVIMGELMQVVIKDSFIYAADRASVYKFSLSGDLMAMISHKGNAPTEYVSISDFQVDKDGDAWVLSRSNKALYKYTWDGSLQKKVPLDIWAEKFSFGGETQILLYTGNEKTEEYGHALYKLDLQTGELTDRYLPINDYKSGYLHVMSQNHFTCGDASHFFYQMFNDTIYAFNEVGALVPEYLLSFDGKNIPDSFYEQKYSDIMDFFQHLFKKDYAYGTGLFLKSDTSCLYSLIYDKRVYWSMTKEGKRALGNVLKDDVCLAGYEIPLGDISCFVQDNNQVVIPLSPYFIMEYANKQADEQERDNITRILKYSGEDQNPVLLKIKL